MLYPGLRRNECLAVQDRPKISAFHRSLLKALWQAGLTFRPPALQQCPTNARICPTNAAPPDLTKWLPSSTKFGRLSVQQAVNLNVWAEGSTDFQRHQVPIATQRSPCLSHPRKQNSRHCGLYRTISDRGARFDFCHIIRWLMSMVPPGPRPFHGPWYALTTEEEHVSNCASQGGNRGTMLTT